MFLLEEEKEHAVGNVGELVIEGLELADDCVLLGGAVTALVEPGNRREDSGYLRTDFLYAAVLEGTLHELVGFFRAKLLFLDDGINFLLLTLTNEGVPVIVHIGARCDGVDERLDKVTLVAQVRTGIDGTLDGPADFLVLVQLVTVLGYQCQDIVDVDFNLLDEFHLKDDVLVDGDGFALLTLFLELVMKVNVHAVVVLNVPVGEYLQGVELLEAVQDIGLLQYQAVQTDELLLLFFAQYHLSRCELCQQFFDQLLVTFDVFAVLVGVAVVVVLERTDEHDALGILVTETCQGRVGGFL